MVKPFQACIIHPLVTMKAKNETNLSLFKGQLGSASGATPKALVNEELRTIMMYVLTNLVEVEPYIQ